DRRGGGGVGRRRARDGRGKLGVSRPLVVLGDALLDRDLTGRADRLSPDAPVPVVSGLSEVDRPGGAGLAALLAARDGAEVVLVTALGDDPAGRRVAELLAAAGVRVVAGRLSGRTPAKERVRVAGQSLLRLDREEAAPAPPAVTEAMTAAGRAGPCWCPTTVAGWRPTRRCGRRWPRPPRRSRWCGTRTRAVPTRCPGRGWSPPTCPRRCGSPAAPPASARSPRRPGPAWSWSTGGGSPV